MELYPYQIEGVAALLSARRVRRGLLLADAPGLGKSAQAIELSNHLAPPSILVVCPASLLINWQREFELWDTWGISLSPITAKGVPDFPYLVCSYDRLIRTDLSERTPDVLIVDESHYAKTRTSERSKTILALCGKVREAGGTVVFMSGTPIENSPIELWHQMVCLGWLPAKSYMEYAKRYCRYHQRTIYIKGRPRHVIDVSGADNLPELKSKLAKFGMVRRRKEDVLKDLPPKTYQIIELPRTKQWRSTLLQSALGDPQVRGQVAYFKNLAAVASKTGDRKRLVESIAEARKIDGVEKVPQVISFVEDILESEKKVVVFCHHREVHEALTNGLRKYGAVGIHGGTTNRQQAVDAFQNDPCVRVFVGQIQAAGTGITLTAASHVVFAEISWVPGQLEQAADRCHRIGQKENVLVQYLVFEDSTDGTVASALIRKQKTLSEMFGANADAYGDPVAIDPIEVFG
jgi:SWI/SNF-related matrix-associated actin-dependent regulator 1 of chromatin subfamily A